MTINSNITDHVAAGKLDWGKIVSKIGMSFAAFIQAKLAKVMGSVISNNTAGNNKDGIAGYIANRFTDNNWLKVARNVELANGGAKVYALGSKIALSNAVPAWGTGLGTEFRYGENSAIVKDGFLPEYKGIPMVELGQALVPNTINGTPEVVLPDDIIYMINYCLTSNKESAYTVMCA